MMIVSLVKTQRNEMYPMNDTNDLVLRAMRIAERAHRTRNAGSHFRKGPDSVDKVRASSCIRWPSNPPRPLGSPRPGFGIWAIIECLYWTPSVL